MRDHYNKYDDGGDIQPSDATFRATLTNPVNSYRSNAPAGIGDAAITKATGLLNPITAATLTAAPLGAISKINAAAKAYKAAKIANPIIASTIGASSTSAGLAGYLDSRPDKKLSRDIEDKNYVGVASDLVEGVTEGLTVISPLRVIDTKGVKKITRPLKKQLTRILRPGDIKVGDNKLSSREAARYYQNIQDRAKIGATVAGAGLGAYGIYKAIDSKKAFGGNIYDGKGTKSNQMNVSFPLKANTKDPSQIQIEQYLYRPPNYDTAKTYTPLYNDKFKNTQDQIDILNALKTTSRRPNRLQNERSWNRFQDRLNVTDSLGWSKVQASAIISRDGFETNFVEDTIQPGGDHAKGALQVHGDREKDMRSRGYNPLSFRDAYKYVDEVIKTDKTFNTHGGKYISGDSMRSMWNNPNVTPEALNKAFIQWFSRSGKPFYKENSEAAKSVYNYILKFNRDEKALIR